VGVRWIICYGGSDLVVQHCSRDWDSKDANMVSYRFYAQQIAVFFEDVSFTMCRLRKMMRLTLFPSWARPGKKFLPE
jgi:hypothetical protein